MTPHTPTSQTRLTPLSLVPAPDSPSRLSYFSRRRWTREGLLFTGILCILLLSAVTSGINQLMLLFGILFGCLLGNFLLVKWNLRRIEVGRRLPSHAFAGDPFDVAIRVTSRKKFLGSWGLRVRDRIASSSQESRPVVFFPRIAARQEQQATYRAVLARRGRYRFGPLDVSSGFPFGLVRAERRSRDEESLVVYPRLGRLTFQWHQPWGLPAQQGAWAVHGRSAIGGDYHSLRDYRAGDSMRWVHWRTSARKGRLMVRQFEQNRTDDLVLLVDLWEPAATNGSPNEAVERAVSFAASLCVSLCQVGGGRLVLAVCGREGTVVHGRTGRGLVPQLLTELACAEASPASDPALCLREVGRYCRRESLLIVVGPRSIDLEPMLTNGIRSTALDSGRGPARFIALNTSDERFSEYFQD